MLCRRSLRLLPPHDACGQGVLNGAPRARDNQPREPYSGSYYRFGGKPIMTKKSERLTSSSDYKNARESGTAASHAECDSGVYLARLLVRRFTFVNKRTADYLGLPQDHPLRFGIDTGAAWEAHIPFLHPDDHGETRVIWSTCLRPEEAGEVSFRARDAQGGYRWFPRSETRPGATAWYTGNYRAFER